MRQTEIENETKTKTETERGIKRILHKILWNENFEICHMEVGKPKRQKSGSRLKTFLIEFWKVK